MKITVTKAGRIGNRRVAAGDEIDLPKQLASAFVRGGFATAAAGDADAEDTATKPKKKTYKTRQVKAEE